MCTVLLPPGDYPVAVNKYIISYGGQITNPNGAALRDFVHLINLK